MVVRPSAMAANKAYRWEMDLSPGTRRMPPTRALGDTNFDRPSIEPY
jgi:hypothetical protein